MEWWTAVSSIQFLLFRRRGVFVGQWRLCPWCQTHYLRCQLCQTLLSCIPPQRVPWVCCTSRLWCNPCLTLRRTPISAKAKELLTWWPSSERCNSMWSDLKMLIIKEILIRLWVLWQASFSRTYREKRGAFYYAKDPEFSVLIQMERFVSISLTRKFGITSAGGPHISVGIWNSPFHFWQPEPVLCPD